MCPMRILLLSWLFLIPFFTVLFGIDIGLVSGQCLNDQRSLLLELKKTLTFNSSISTKMVQWNSSTDCCHWSGVACNKGGHVIGLNLNSESISDGINESSSLFSLQFLERLNLAYNSFNLTQIPSSFGNLTSLTYLNLSNAGFVGHIPIGLSRLTRLVTLDLSSLFFAENPSLQLGNSNLLTLLQNLSGLTELHLDGVNISARGSEWSQAISSSLPNLRVLSLSNCYLSGPIDSSFQELRFLSVIHLGFNNLSSPVPEFFANFSNLRVFSLSSSNLYGIFPEKIFQVPTLQTLVLANNKFLQGSLPQFPQNGSLQNLVLSNTNFSGILPVSFGDLRQLSRIELSGCNFTGPIPNSMEMLSQLVYLDLSSNMFTGPIPSFQVSKNLNYMDLSHNALTGPVPSFYFGGLSNLVNIDLSHNSFSGGIPSSLFSLPSLQKIQLSYNQFSGQVAGFPNESLSPLDTLDLSSNKLEGPIPTSFLDCQMLRVLSLSFNNFNGSIQLEKFKNLERLELSYNSFSINESERTFSLSSFPRLSILRLASCKLQKFPALMNQLRMIHLDLSDNKISGEIPDWIWNVGNGTLAYLNLSCNLLDDLQRPYIIPNNLSVLDLHSNQLHGEIPIPPESATYVDYSSNSFSSSIPDEIGNNIAFATFFSLSNNGLTGAIPQSICNATNLEILDLSNNGFSGSVPRCLIENCTKSLVVLNLRNNTLTGDIQGTFPENCVLKTLDFSGNHLEGQVPKSLANCAMLEVLNLGNNNISDNFPCFLKNSACLRVLVLRSNKYQGGIHCPGDHNNSWPKLQIIDIALNNFRGVLPPNSFLHWKAMMIDGANSQSELSHLPFEFLNLNNHFYYQDTVIVTSKVLQMELVKILTVFSSIDFSDNNFQGEIPDTVGNLKSLYVLNLSHNALTGQIPSSLGNLTQLGSLDLSQNRLSGYIPAQLASLTFLSFLDLSYNHLVGKIPSGPQFQTFSNTSFEGNIGLCGTPLSARCANASPVPSPTPSPDESGSVSMKEFNWVYIFATLGFGMGFGVVVGPLVYSETWRKRYYKHVDPVILRILRRQDQRRVRNIDYYNLIWGHQH